MKKVLILVVALLLVASVAFGLTIKGSKHDLSSTGPGLVGDANEICVYCHTPHGSNTAMTAAPLWNRTGMDFAWVLDYTSTSLNGTANHTGAISQACLSCHDGDVGDEVLANAPGSGNANTAATFAGGSTFASIANLNDGVGLRNDHPIGIVIDAALVADDPGIKTAASILSNGLTLYGSGLDTVECASCHKVHDNAIAPFLRMTNANSQMCLTCQVGS